MLTDVTPGMAIAQEEICGPVATLIRYKDQAEAVAFANAGFGLAATVWTGDPQRGLDIAKRTRVGTFGINLYEPDLGSPWGGRGSSGTGSAYGPEGMDPVPDLEVGLPARDALDLQHRRPGQLGASSQPARVSAAVAHPKHR